MEAIVLRGFASTKNFILSHLLAQFRATLCCSARAAKSRPMHPLSGPCQQWVRPADFPSPDIGNPFCRSRSARSRSFIQLSQCHSGWPLPPRRPLPALAGRPTRLGNVKSEIWLLRRGLGFAGYAFMPILLPLQTTRHSPSFGRASSIEEHKTAVETFTIISDFHLSSCS